MLPRQAVPESLTRLALLQGGVVSTAQVLGSGLSRHALARLLGEGWWSRITRGVLLTAPGEPSWSALAWAGVLLGGDRARLGYDAAAWLHELGRSAPESLDVLVPATTSPEIEGPWRFTRERSGHRSPRSVGDPPRTTVEDTVLDLCERSGETEVVDWLTRAVQGRRTSAKRLLAVAQGRSRLRHRRLVTAVLADVGAGAESPLELAYLREVERPHGLPRAGRQVRRHGYRTDVDYEAYAVLVELDGRRGHEGSDRFRDFSRDNTFALEGRVTLRYGWRDVAGLPCQVARQVAEVLTMRGWAGLFQSCPRCRSAHDAGW